MYNIRESLHAPYYLDVTIEKINIRITRNVLHVVFMT